MTSAGLERGRASCSLRRRRRPKRQRQECSGAVVGVAEGKAEKEPSDSSDACPNRGDARRVTVRRGVALARRPSPASRALVALLGAGYLWPLFLFPLLLGAVFFFELGSLAVTVWLGQLLRRSTTASPAADGRRGAAGAARHRPLLRLRACCSAACSAAAATRSARSRRPSSPTGSPACTTTARSSTTCTTRSPRSTATAASSRCSCSTSTTSSGSTTATATRPATTCCAASAPTLALRGARRRPRGALRRRGVRRAHPRRRAHGYELAERLRRAVETITVEVRGGEQV